MILNVEELPKRIAWAQPGGPLNTYLESLKKTVATDNSYSAWFPIHAALIYLLTGEEDFAEKAYTPKHTWGERVWGAPFIYDWLVAADAYWKKNTFPVAQRKRFEESLAEQLAPRYEDGAETAWTPGSSSTLSSRLAAARALLGVPEYDAKTRQTFNSHAKFAVEHYLPAWNVAGGFLACGVSYASQYLSEGLVIIHAMMDGCTGQYNPWSVSRYARERLLKKFAQEIPHAAMMDGLGGLPEPHGDIDAVPYGSAGVRVRRA